MTTDTEALPPLQGGMTNDELRAALESKLQRGATYSDQDLTPFALGVEYGAALAQRQQVPAAPQAAEQGVEPLGWSNALALRLFKGSASDRTLIVRHAPQFDNDVLLYTAPQAAQAQPQEPKQ